MPRSFVRIWYFFSFPSDRNVDGSFMHTRHKLTFFSFFVCYILHETQFYGSFESTLGEVICRIMWDHIC
jgi:hypothetical protein